MRLLRNVMGLWLIAGVPIRELARRRQHSTTTSCSRTARAADRRRAAVRPRHRLAAAPAAHADADRRAVSRGGSAGAAERPRHSWSARSSSRWRASTASCSSGCRLSAAGGSSRSTWSAAAAATSCCASSPPTSSAAGARGPGRGDRARQRARAGARDRRATSLAEMRELVARSCALQRYEPRPATTDET